MATPRGQDQDGVAPPRRWQAVYQLVPILTGVDQPPLPHLDPFLDAASSCFARFGIRHTSVQDVAREIGVDRTTVYRQVGNVAQMLRLLAARDLQRMLASIAGNVAVPLEPRDVVATMAAVVEAVRAHEVVAKVLADDPESISLAGSNDLPLLLTGSAAVVGPVLEEAMRNGQLARHDPLVLAEWLVRMVVSLVLVPARGDIESLLSEILLPVLEP